MNDEGKPTFMRWEDTATKKPPPEGPELKREFLDHLERTGDTLQAASAISVEHGTVWSWRVKDSVFAREWDEVIRVRILPVLEAEAVRRACRNSDSMLQFLLKAYDRERYDDAVARLRHVPKDSGITLVLQDVDGTDLASARQQIIRAAIENDVIDPSDLADD